MDAKMAVRFIGHFLPVPDVALAFEDFRQSAFYLGQGDVDVGRSMRTALRMRVNMSAMGSVIILLGSLYQLAFRTPGIIPSSAKLRKQILQMPNLRYTARGRPHIRHRLTRRVEN